MPVIGQTLARNPLRAPRWTLATLLALAGCTQSAPPSDFVPNPDSTTSARETSGNDSDAAPIDARDFGIDAGDAVNETPLDAAIDSGPPPADADAAVDTYAAPIDTAIPDPFADAPPFSYVAPDATSVQGHAQLESGVTSPMCLTCHGAGGSATPFAFGGSAVFTTDAGAVTIPPLAEVRLVDGNGQVLRDVFTDSTGFFWSLGAPTDLPTTFYAGIRNATGAFTMPEAASPNCNQPMCHGPLNISE